MFFRFRTREPNLPAAADPAAALVNRWLTQARLGRVPLGGSQRRRRSRWGWSKKLYVFTTSGERVRVHAKDLSAGGLGFASKQQLNKGELVRLTEQTNTTLWVQARVVYVSEPDETGHYRTGVEFVFGDAGESATRVL